MTRGSYSSVSVAAVTNIMNHHSFRQPIELIHDPIIADPDSVESLHARQFDNTARKRIVGQCVDAEKYPFQIIAGDAAKVFFH